MIFKLWLIYYNIHFNFIFYHYLKIRKRNINFVLNILCVFHPYFFTCVSTYVLCAHLCVLLLYLYMCVYSVLNLCVSVCAYVTSLSCVCVCAGFLLLCLCPPYLVCVCSLNSKTVIFYSFKPHIFRFSMF